MTTAYSFLPSITLSMLGAGFTQNTPMNERKIVLHKGILNKFELKIYNADRKPINLAQQKVFWRLIQHGFGAVALGPVTVVNASRGTAQVEINDRDIGDMVPGLYHMTFSLTDVEGIETNLYSNLAGAATIVIEISEGLFMESTEANITMQFSSMQDGWHYTNIMAPRPGSNGINTVSYRMWNFTGEIKAEKTIEDSLNNPVWQLIKLDGNDVTAYVNQSQTVGFTVSEEMRLIRFGWRAQANTTGTVDKIIFRS